MISKTSKIVTSVKYELQIYSCLEMNMKRTNRISRVYIDRSDSEFTKQSFESSNQGKFTSKKCCCFLNIYGRHREGTAREKVEQYHMVPF